MRTEAEMAPALRCIRAVLAGAMIGGLLVGGLGVDSAAAALRPSIAVSKPPCLPMRSPIDHRIVVGVAANGKTLCVSLGDRLLVDLRAGSAGSSWRAVAVSPAGVLRRLAEADRPVAATVFFAARSGTARLVAEPSGCASASGPASCAKRRWSATVVVLGTHATVGGPQPVAPSPQPVVSSR